MNPTTDRTYATEMMHSIWKSHPCWMMMKCNYVEDGIEATFLNEKDHRFYEIKITPKFSPKEQECTPTKQ